MPEPRISLYAMAKAVELAKKHALQAKWTSRPEQEYHLARLEAAFKTFHLFMGYEHEIRQAVADAKAKIAAQKQVEPTPDP